MAFCSQKLLTQFNKYLLRKEQISEEDAAGSSFGNHFFSGKPAHISKPS